MDADARPQAEILRCAQDDKDTYIGVAALALWLLGQLAVLGPALRAARVPPTMAMRVA